MDLRRLRYFVAVAEELHFRRAAERLYVTQPVVSEQIRKLEAELGVTLLHRTQQRVSLTTSGAALLEDARRLLAHADQVTETARRTRAHLDTRVRAGYGPDVVPAALNRALTTVRGAEVELHPRPGDARALLDDVRRGRLDVAIACLPAPVAGLRVQEVGAEGALVAVPARAGAGAMPPASLTLRELAAEPLLTFERATNPAWHDAVVSAFDRAGLAPELVERPATTIEALLLDALATRGRALVPSGARRRLHADGVALVPIAEGGPTVTVAAVTRDEEPSPALLALARELDRPRLTAVA